MRDDRRVLLATNTLGVVSSSRYFSGEPFLMWPLPPKSFAIIGRSSSRESEFVVNGSSWWRVSSSSHTPSMMAIGSGRRTLKDSQS